MFIIYNISIKLKYNVKNKNFLLNIFKTSVVCLFVPGR